jgi:transposase
MRNPRNPTVYLKMRIIGTIDSAPAATIRDRIKAVSQMLFTDEDGFERQFTWRTIQTWHQRYKKHGSTAMESQPRSDKGKIRKVSLERIQEAIEKIRPKIHIDHPTSTMVYRLCIEEKLLHPAQIAVNTYRRHVKQYQLLKPLEESSNQLRLAFSKAHANELWQADTLYGPIVHHSGARVQTRLIAFIDDASRVCCHGQFFPTENVDTLIDALRNAFYKRGVLQARCSRKPLR